jgi:hypothetical protein
MQNASEKKPKRQHIFPKGKKEEIKMRPLSKPGKF